MNSLLSFFGASLSALPEFAACFALFSLIMRREVGMPLSLYDAGLLIAILLIVAWLARRIVRPFFYKTHFFNKWILGAREETVPSTSGAHLAWDLAFISIGLIVLYAEYSVPTPIDGSGRDFGFGAGLVIVPLFLFVLRLIFWHRRPRW